MSSLKESSTINVVVVGSQTQFVFHWPGGVENYDGLLEVRVSGAGCVEPLQLYVAYGYRKAFGRLRRRILVFRNQADVLAEFVGTDDWPQSNRVATFLRRDGTKKYLRSGDRVPSRYTQFSITDPSSVITGPYAPRCLAAVVPETDLPTLVAIALARDEGESTSIAQTAIALDIAPKAKGEHLEVGSGNSQAVVRALLDYRAQQKTGGPFTKNHAANKFLRENPFAFLMAASIDRGAPAEAVWEIPFHLCNRLGHLDPRRLAQMTPHEIEKALRALDRMPRYPKQSARTIFSLSTIVVSRFGSNAANVWHERQPIQVVQTLDDIWGVGPGIAHMTVRILKDEFGYDPGADGWSQVDVKPDVQVRRLFYRTGLASDRSENTCVQAARQLHPEFPGLLDWPAWEIGRTWCRENNPDCAACPLSHICPKLGN